MQNAEICKLNEIHGIPPLLSYGQSVDVRLSVDFGVRDSRLVRGGPEPAFQYVPRFPQPVVTVGEPED